MLLTLDEALNGGKGSSGFAGVADPDGVVVIAQGVGG